MAKKVSANLSSTRLNLRLTAKDIEDSRKVAHEVSQWLRDKRGISVGSKTFPEKDGISEINAA